MTQEILVESLGSELGGSTQINFGDRLIASQFLLKVGSEPQPAASSLVSEAQSEAADTSSSRVPGWVRTAWFGKI